jgi:TolC family type I secretion outer membrane protein
LALILMGCLFAAAQSQADTVADVRSSAYQSNPTLQAQRAALRGTDENVSQALSGWRPTVSLSGTAGHQRVDSKSAGDRSLGQRNVKLSVTQPLYRGGRTVAATRQTENLVLAGRAQLIATEQRVLLAAATSFLNVLRDQALVTLNRNNVQVLNKQLEATRDRFQVGEITRTDVAQAEARLSGAISQRVQSEGNLTSTRAAFASVIGFAPGDLVKPAPLTNMPKSEREALELALENNPNLAIAMFNERASHHAVRGQLGNLYPTVSLSGDLSKTEDGAARGSSVNSAFLGVTVSVPLYQAGGAYSSLRQSRYVNSQRRIQVEEARRSTEENLTQAWGRLITAQASKEARTQQVRAAAIALEGVREELSVGSRTTLDMLDSEQELLDARVSLVAAERDELVATFDLVSAMGGLTAESLGLKLNIYDPAVNYDRARGTLFGATVAE